MAMDVMIDLETCGTGPDAAIMQIGAVFFEPRSGGRILNDKSFNEYLDPHENASYDVATQEWWAEQSLVARTRIVAGIGKAKKAGITEADVLEKLTHWPGEVFGISWEGIDAVWAMPAHFDLPILKSAYRRAGIQEPPWQRRSVRCAATVFALNGNWPTVDKTGLVAHDALDDAVVQAMMVQKALSTARA
jgi:DNA polymerase III epsilon subunit-like protein